MRSTVVLVAVLTVCLGSPRRPAPHHPSAELIDRALQGIGDSRIINGTDAEISDFAWQASLRYNGKHICGASIISERWLVSAAHCTQYSLGGYSVGVGDREWEKHETRLVSQIINHEEYNNGSGTFPNDISLIELAQPIVESEGSKPINLAPQNSDHSGNENCYISGWGLKSGNGTKVADILQSAQTKVLSTSVCRRKWGYFNINNGHVCIGGQSHEGSCNGDSGGPLVCEVDGSYELVGATSWGYNGCRTDYPSVYSKIAYFRDWIDKNTNIAM